MRVVVVMVMVRVAIEGMVMVMVRVWVAVKGMVMVRVRVRVAVEGMAQVAMVEILVVVLEGDFGGASDGDVGSGRNGDSGGGNFGGKNGKCGQPKKLRLIRYHISGDEAKCYSINHVRPMPQVSKGIHFQ